MKKPKSRSANKKHWQNKKLRKVKKGGKLQHKLRKGICNTGVEVAVHHN